MPTTVEPNRTQETTTPSPTPVSSPEPELFAAEIAMESKSSNFFPIVLVACLVLVVGGTIVYFIRGARDVLTAPVATTTLTQVLQKQGPAKVRFTVGTLTASVSDKISDPHYKMLTKAGIVVTKANGPNKLNVSLTTTGENILAGIQDVQKGKTEDNNVTYDVPLALRTLVSVDKVTMIKPHLAQVEYTWKWTPNRLGNEFDASGSLVKSFNTWDRATLIKSYGVDFYSGAPTRSSIVLMEKDDGSWKPYVE